MPNNPPKSDYELKVSLSALRHLGINLYSNIPAVISEAVANSWDADAELVEIDIDERNKTITITDDGTGMDENDLNDKYLSVGYMRREREPPITHIHHRHVMGRKGIGKLSLFSIAKTIEVTSVKKDNTGRIKKNGLRMKL
ncbi:MAG: ATP-binding protein [Pyrinomonadaceae bacterium]